ncbi:DUF1150 domain-containing protein [Kaustia mangrovi]|uniref:DUF1150 domain-containing protein n=2 Tax=Kaustia mangrovi TaxID=2593653 RepID=A0A7S8C875_9HYPH|nr:DUF1150 domain-containing protein [Kaustia mangrovi]
MSTTELASLGGGEIGYVREIEIDKAAELLGSSVDVPADTTLFALYSADGTPMAIADSREGALANAFEHDLEAISVH